MKSADQNGRASYFLVFGGLALLAWSGWFSFFASQPKPSATTMVVSLLVAGAVYLATVYFAAVRKCVAATFFILAIALASRAIVLFSPILFDDDIYRYIWDGKVLVHGFNPFVYPPQADELAGLRDVHWAQIGYPEVRTIYPPGSQLLFALSRLLGLGSVLGLKSFLMLFDIANIVLILKLLARFGRPRTLAIVYAWSPLAIKEFQNSGHLEPAMIFFLLLAFYFWTRSRPNLVWAGLSFGAALLVKFVPVLLLPAAWRHGRWKSLVCAGGLVAVLYLPFAGAGKLLFSGACVYSQYWTFNYGLFAILLAAQERLLPGYAIASMPPARLLSALLIVGYAIYAGATFDTRDRSALPRTARNVLAVCLLLMPVLDPWYVCWLLPFLCFAPSAGLLALTVTCNLSYLYYVQATFPVWIPIAEYVPVFLLLVVEFLRRRKHSVSLCPAADAVSPAPKS